MRADDGLSSIGEALQLVRADDGLFFSFSGFGFRWADDGLSSIGEALQFVRAGNGLFLF